MMLLDSGHLNHPEISILRDLEVSKSCSLENGGDLESIIQAHSGFQKCKKSILYGGVNPPNFLEETHTSITYI